MADFTQPMQVPGGGGGISTQGIGGPNVADYGTLDEPVTETIMRDLRMVGNKMMCVLNPRKANIQTLKDWDLWGPLILCLLLATLLSWCAPYEQASLVFASVFVIIWCGAAVVTVNALLLGGNISFFQSVCVLGYCIFPLNIASIICILGGHIVWRVCVVAVCFFWSTGASLGASPPTRASAHPPARRARHAAALCHSRARALTHHSVVGVPLAGFMGELVPPNRKALAVYPLFLFYTAIGWLILVAARPGSK